ncbi:MAG TPA: DUF1592 domain-containing protein [Pirellulaceae bacterium]|nr:DUF1592 domain-containing protein [Pirellulaceae bacterium]
MTRFSLAGWILLFACSAAGAARADEAAAFGALAEGYDGSIRPLLARYCLDCHDAASKEGELDLERYASLAELRSDPAPWQLVAQLLESGEMPPEEADQPTKEELLAIRSWVDEFLDAEARSRAGDPGPVVLRRLNNAEYGYTIRELTGVEGLDPARDFPPDGAAGEGFTNTGQALAMSPALAEKYFAAAKDVARHAVLLPNGIRFSKGVSREDWTEEGLTKIREFYRQRSAPMQSAEIELHGLVWESADGGKLPLAAYFEATIVERAALSSGAKSFGEVAKERGLSERYLITLWNQLNDATPSPSLDPLRTPWRAAGPTDAAALAGEVERWQQALWNFNRVGHLGRVDGPTSWMEPKSPLAASGEIRLPFADYKGEVVTLYLAATPVGNGQGVAVWNRPRLVGKDRPELPLRDLRTTVARFEEFRARVFKNAGRSFAAIDEALGVGASEIDWPTLAKSHGIREDELAAWLELTQVRVAETPIAGRFETPLPVSDYPFVRGWGRPETPSAFANASDQEVRIPGTLPDRSVAVHPSPEQDAGAAWRSPVDAAVRVSGRVRDSHDACGNGLSWRLELRRGAQRLTLASGSLGSGEATPLGPLEQVVVRRGDVLALVVGARDKDHICDLTGIDLSISDAAAEKTWDLAVDLTTDAKAENPAPDRFGNAGVWHLFAEPAGTASLESGDAIDNGALARWLLAVAPDERRTARESLAKLFAEGPTAATPEGERALYERFASPGGPLFPLASRTRPVGEIASSVDEDAEWGLDPALFGKLPDGTPMDEQSLAVEAPGIVAIRLPRALVEGYEFVAETSALPENPAGVQMRASWQPPREPLVLQPDQSILASEGSAAWDAVEADFAQFRDLFPAALCYTKIVPIDEVVTLRLIHREDEPLRRLLLSPEEIAWLDRAWEELRFVGQDAIRQVAAFEQLMEYASQDADPSVFAPLRGPINDAAEAFERRLAEAEPAHVAAAIEFAERAWRRPLTVEEKERLQGLYDRLRSEETPHDEAIRTLLARVFVSPAFLYRLEQAPPGERAHPVDDHELAVRLSYFLWSSPPDEELRRIADRGELSKPDELLRQTRRMLQDDRVSRLAKEFGCQWLQVRDFATSDEKSPAAFPEFADLRDDMAEEPARFFTDFFRQDRSIASLFEADVVFVNRPLAQHYGIPWDGAAVDDAADDDPEWRRVEGAKALGRGGILGMAAVLAKQSGASRTSPVLRGTWVSESLLGERLPRPPKGVPPLPEETPVGLTERELVAKHAEDASCAKCHVRIDPFGFALEGYDGIGRRRDRYAKGQPIDASAQLVDGTQFVGADGLRDYLLGQRREQVLRQFCRKLLGYALGRSVRLSDEPLLDEMLANLDARDGRISAAVETIVLSEQFRNIRGADWTE